MWLNSNFDTWNNNPMRFTTTNRKRKVVTSSNGTSRCGVRSVRYRVVYLRHHNLWNIDLLACWAFIPFTPSHYWTILGVYGWIGSCGSLGAWPWGRHVLVGMSTLVYEVWLWGLYDSCNACLGIICRLRPTKKMKQHPIVELTRNN